MVDARDHQRGVLIDLDIAARVKDGNKPLRPVLTHAGTLGFRGIDVLRADTHYPNRAVYRDDLESFYYVLFYLQTFYRDGKHLPIHDRTGWWDILEGDIHGLGMRKLQSLSMPIMSALETPLAAWLEPLRELFLHGYEARDDDPEKWSARRESSLDGRVTYENFMKICAS